MADKKLPIKPEQIIDIILRYRWVAIVPFCLSMIVGIYLSLTLPKIYGARTLILVQPQKVPSNFVQSLVSRGIDERISTIKQQILSRSNLEKIIEDFKLFSEPEHDKMYPEDKIENLRKRISVYVTSARSGADAFSVSFKGKDPEKVMQVANSLASYFINENLKVREAQAIGTSDFLDDQLSSMRERLNDLEEALRLYRTKHMGSLPEQLETNLRILERLQQQLEARQSNLGAAKVSLLALERQMSEEKSRSGNIPASVREGTTVSTPDDSLRLQEMKTILEDLKTRYTEKHPDVIRLTRAVEDLEREIENPAPEKEKDNNLDRLSQNESPEFDSLAIQKAQRNEIIREIKNHEAEINRITEQINIYQQRVEDTPKREQELLSLRRDYNNIQQAYSSLLNRKLEAEMSVNMEKKQKGEQFRILDPAKLPEKPVSPNMKKLFALSLTAGLGIGGGLVFLLFYFDTAFRTQEEVEAQLKMPVLVTLPTIYHPADVRRQKISWVLSFFSLFVSFALLAGFAFLTIKGP